MIEALQAMGSVIFDPYLVVLILITTVLGVVIGVRLCLAGTRFDRAAILEFAICLHIGRAHESDDGHGKS